MNIYSKEQESLLQEIEELEWNCQAVECVNKCEQYISQYPNCRKVIPSYAHMYQFIDYKKATDITKKQFDEDHFYFKNTYIYAYLLFDFEKRGRNDLQVIYDTYKEYQGEKDIYYYMTIAIAAKQLGFQEQNILYLEEAVNLFQGKDKMIARVYHHLAATTGSSDYLKLSIGLQPNFDYNYMFVASQALGLGDNQLAFKNYQKLLSINPINFVGLFKLGSYYYEMEETEKFDQTFEDFLKLKQYFPLKIYDYLSMKIYIENEKKDQSQVQKIPIDIIKKTFLLESNHSYNTYLYIFYIDNQKYFTTPDNFFPQLRELLQFYWQNSLSDYKLITENSAQREFELILIEENDEIISSLLLILAYQKHLKDIITFKSQFISWDFYIQ